MVLEYHLSLIFFKQNVIITKFFGTLSLSLKRASGQKSFRSPKQNIASKRCTFDTFHFDYAKYTMRLRRKYALVGQIS